MDSPAQSALQVAVHYEDAQFKVCGPIIEKFRNSLDNPKPEDSAGIIEWIPNFEKELFKENIDLYVQNAWEVLSHWQENTHYVCRDGEIKSVDIATGTTQSKMKFSHGIHHLEGKHGLPLSTFGMSGETITSLTYFKL